MHWLWPCAVLREEGTLGLGIQNSHCDDSSHYPVEGEIHMQISGFGYSHEKVHNYYNYKFYQIDNVRQG